MSLKIFEKYLNFILIIDMNFFSQYLTKNKSCNFVKKVQIY